MTEAARGQDKFSMKLLPHQASFVESVLSPTNRPFVWLRGGVGLGKTTAMAALAGRLLRERPTARILVLCPAALRSQWLELLRNEGAAVMPVDRYRFREMLEAGGGREVWSRGRVAVLSDDFAKHADIRDSLASARWDLVVADEAHRIVGARARLIRDVSVVAERVVLATLPHVALDEVPELGNVTLIDWQPGQLVSLDGKPLDVAQRPLVLEAPFMHTQAEKDVWETVKAVCQLIEASTPQGSLVAKVLRRSLGSSPAALERVLRNVVAPPEQTGAINPVLESSGELGEETLQRIEAVTTPEARAMAVRAVEKLEAIQVDSKLNVFGALVGDLITGEARRRVCVLTNFISTLYYLAADMEGRSVANLLLHGGMPTVDRYERLTAFEANGGVLIASRAVMTEGVSLPYVTDLVLYDLPASGVVLEEILGRFERFGRTTQLRIHALVPSPDVGGVLKEELRVLRAILSCK